MIDHDLMLKKESRHVPFIYGLIALILVLIIVAWLTDHAYGEIQDNSAKLFQELEKTNQDSWTCHQTQEHIELLKSYFRLMNSLEIG